MDLVNKYINSQKGSAIVVALMILLILSVLGTAVVGVAGMEGKLAIQDVWNKQARQSADAGVQIAKDVVINYIGAGKSISTDGGTSDNEVAIIEAGLDDIAMGDNHITIKSIVPDPDTGFVTIVSEGRVEKNGKTVAKKTAQVEMFVNILPSYAVQCEEFKLIGKYYTDFDPGNKVEWREVKEEIQGENRLAHLYGPTKERNATLPFNPSDPEYDPNLNPPLNPNDYLNPNRNSWWVDYAYDNNGWLNTFNHKAHIIPYYKSQGKVNIYDMNRNPDKVAIDHWYRVLKEDDLSDSELNELFYKVDDIFKTWRLDLVGELYNERYPVPLDISVHDPIKILNSDDFIGELEEVDKTERVPKFGDKELNRFLKTAIDGKNVDDIEEDIYRQENGPWAYVKGDAVIIDDDGTQKTIIVDEILNIIKRPYIYVDLDESETLNIDLRTVTTEVASGKWGDYKDVITKLKNQWKTFLNTWSNDLKGVVIVTPANINLAFDSLMFQPDTEGEKAMGMYLFSPGNISFMVDAKIFNGTTRIFPDSGGREIRAYLLAGQNINIISTPAQLDFTGYLCATEQIFVQMDYYDNIHITDIEKDVDIYQDKSVIEDFYGPTSTLCVGTITSYKYID